MTDNYEDKQFKIQNVLSRSSMTIRDWLIDAAINDPNSGDVIFVYNSLTAAKYSEIEYRKKYNSLPFWKKWRKRKHPQFRSISSSFIGESGKFIIDHDVLWNMESPATQAVLRR